MGWFNSPQYLKGIQKIKSMSPEKKAVTQTLIDELSGLYAGSDMQRQLQDMRIASMDKRMDRSAELAEDRLGLEKKAYKHMKDETKAAENLGWANIGLSGLAGYGDMLQGKKKAKFYEDLSKKLYGSK